MLCNFCLSCSFTSLYCLSFDILLRIAPLVFLNFSFEWIDFSFVEDRHKNIYLKNDYTYHPVAAIILNFLIRIIRTVQRVKPMINPLID